MTFDDIETAVKNSSNKGIFGSINEKFPVRYEDEVGDITPSQIEYFVYNVTDEFGVFPNVINFTSKLETTTEHSAIIRKAQDNVFESGLIIPLYVAIFVLSVVGNSLVLATLAQNKRMRTVTNVYLLNLVSGYKSSKKGRNKISRRFKGIVYISLQKPSNIFPRFFF